MEEKAYLYALCSSGISPRMIQTLLEKFGSPERVWFAEPSSITESGDLHPNTRQYFIAFRQSFDPKKAWDEFSRSGCHALALTDSAYPQALRSIYDPPPLLFVK